MARPSKIAQLPTALRNELNERLEEGQMAKDLLPWLNTEARSLHSEPSKPGADQVEFIPITEQNLSDWRRGGFVEWQLREELREKSLHLAEATADLAEINLHSKQLLAVLSAHFASSLLAWDGTPSHPSVHKMHIIQRLINGVLALRRSEQQAERLELDRERLAFAREIRSRRPSEPAPATPTAEFAEAPSQAIPSGKSGNSRESGKPCPSTPPATPPPVSLTSTGLITPPLQSSPSRAQGHATADYSGRTYDEWLSHEEESAQAP